VYTTLLGRDMGLTDEVKWQAVTHKSFDHGRQPFNEKLAIYGVFFCMELGGLNGGGRGRERELCVLTIGKKVNGFVGYMPHSIY